MHVPYSVMRCLGNCLNQTLWVGEQPWKQGCKSCVCAAESCCSPGERVLAAASMTEALRSVILSCSHRLQPLSNLGKCLNRSLVFLRYCDVPQFLNFRQSQTFLDPFLVLLVSAWILGQRSWSLRMQRSHFSTVSTMESFYHHFRTLKLLGLHVSLDWEHWTVTEFFMQV
jgi:hypothetical protein